MKKAIPFFFCVVITVLLLSAVLFFKVVPQGKQSRREKAVQAAPAAAAVSPTETVFQEEPEILETSAAFSWELPAPENLEAGEKNAAVTYRIVHETVYAVGPLYVRAEPGSRAPIIGKLSKGEVVRRGAVGNNGWSQILYDGREAYVNSTYLSVTPVDPLADPAKGSCQPMDDVLYATAVTKLRSGPGPDYAVMGHLTAGNGVSRVAMGEDGWSKIIFHDTEVYACTGALAYERPGEECLFVPGYVKTDEQVYARSWTSIFEKPFLPSEALGILNRGDSITRIGVGNNGWSKVIFEDRECFVPTGYLSVDPAPAAPTVVTSAVEKTTPNAPFIYQYMAPENIMPHAFFTPANADCKEPLPLLISLHGALEIGEAPETLRSNFITKEICNWEYTGLQGFDAYVVCPQMTGCGYDASWCTPKSADNLFALIDYLLDHYPIDENKIMIEGHSLGGQGALYMAADPRACFSCVVPVSAYSPFVPCGGISVPVRGYTGSPYLPTPREDWDSFRFMTDLFARFFGSQNLHMRNCSHYDIPMVAFEEDLNRDGASDLIQWMMAQ